MVNGEDFSDKEFGRELLGVSEDKSWHAGHVGR